MADQHLLAYIHAAQQEGQPVDTIKHTLMANGWQEALVDEALATPMAPMPVGAQTTPRKLKHSINSHFSILLAIVLTIALFILTNKIITDLGQTAGFDISAKLIADALIILPFLLLAFGLHFSLGEQSPKYLILSRPYYLIAGWLLIRLLYEVSTYLLDQNTTYGIYVVLFLVIAVLTGMIVYVQKYLRK